MERLSRFCLKPGGNVPQLRVQRISQKIIINVAHEMHKTLLLLAF